MKDSNLPMSQNKESVEARIKQGKDLAIDALLKSAYSSSGAVEKELKTPQLNLVNIRSRPQLNNDFMTAYAGWSALAAVIVVLSVIGFLIYAQPSGDPRHLTVVSITGSVEYEKKGTTVEAGIGDTIYVGDIIMTGENSGVELSYKDGTNINLGPESTLKTTENSTSVLAKSLLLSVGDVKISAAKQRKNNSLYVISPHSVMKVIGTVFNVSVKSDFTELSVIEGQVEMARKDGGEPVQVYESQVAKLGHQTTITEPETSSENSTITGFTLIDVGTGKAMPAYDPLSDGATLSLSKLPDSGINIRINTAGEVDSIQIEDSGTGTVRIEKVAPYTVAEDLIHQTYSKLPLELGRRQIIAIPMKNDQSGERKILNIKVVE